MPPKIVRENCQNLVVKNHFFYTLCMNNYNFLPFYDYSNNSKIPFILYNFQMFYSSRLNDSKI